MPSYVIEIRIKPWESVAANYKKQNRGARHPNAVGEMEAHPIYEDEVNGCFKFI